MVVHSEREVEPVTILKDPQGLVTHAENSTTSDMCLLGHPSPVGHSPPAHNLLQGLWVQLLPSLTWVKVSPVSIYNSTKFISLPSARNVCVWVEKVYVQGRSLVFRLVSWQHFSHPSVVLRAMVKPEGLREKPRFLTPDFHTPAWCSAPVSPVPPRCVAMRSWGRATTPLPQFEF